MAKIRVCSVLVAALAAAVIPAGCAKTSEAPKTPAATESTSPAPAAAPADLQSMIPVPADVTMTKGPDPIANKGIHLHYEVKGAPNEVMTSFEKALEGKGWDVMTIVASGSDWGGGATYTGTKGSAYGVFDGGGPSDMTYIDVCVWAAKPTDPNCARSR